MACPPAATVSHAARIPPISVLFAAFLGYNPVEHLIGSHALSAVSAHTHAVLMGRSFFPRLISAPFQSGLRVTFAFAIGACLVAAGASLMRGGRYHAEEVALARAGLGP